MLAMPVPQHPKIYHIAHIDRLQSIVADGFLWCDAETVRRQSPGTNIGINSIKQTRLTKPLQSHSGLFVGDCVPFYFCPRSVMLYMLHRGNHPELPYRGRQGPIIHLESDLHKVIAWANAHNRRWAFTTANAAAGYTADYANLAQLDRVDWNAVAARHWSGPGIDPLVSSRKQAEFLLEHSFPWHLVERVGVFLQRVASQAREVLQTTAHQPPVGVMPGWYY